MTASFELTALFEQTDEGWTQARIAELPGVITAAPTVEEAKEPLADALREYLIALAQLDGTSSEDAAEGHPFVVTLNV